MNNLKHGDKLKFKSDDHKLAFIDEYEINKELVNTFMSHDGMFIVDYVDTDGDVWLDDKLGISLSHAKSCINCISRVELNYFEKV